MRDRVKRVGLFVDGQNLYQSVRQAFGEVRIDYGALIRFAAQQGTVRIANLYTARDYNNPNQDKFLSSLTLKGFRVMTRPLKTMSDGSKKGNIDVLMAYDIAEQARALDVVILVTGDSDFAEVADILTKRGKTVIVIGPNGCTGVELLLS
ncbi:MAG: NYN domain-containing protein, partial [Fimbriimonadales bacterium]